AGSAPGAGCKQTGTAVVRLNFDGSLDTTFNGTGKKAFEIIPGAVGSDVANAVAVDANGGIVLAGTSEFNPGDTLVAVVRLNTNGSIDSNFGLQGHNFIGFHTSGKHLDGANPLAIHGQGRVRP